MAAVRRGKVRDQYKIGAHQFRCDPKIIRSLKKIHQVVSEEFSGMLRGGVEVKT